MSRFLMIGLMMVAGIALLAIDKDASAATIFGTVYLNNQPYANKELTLNCGSGPLTSNTDARGSYRLNANHVGPCTLSSGTLTTEVILYQNPSRYDFDVSGSQLRRR
jgi:hypothetical protein